MNKIGTPGLLRRKFLAAGAAALALTAGAAGMAPAACAAAWPSQPLRLIVPFGAGSSPDQMSRVIGEKLGKILGQNVIIVNRPGAGGNLGTFDIANAKPDGYTFGISITGPLVNNTLIYKKLPYNPATDLAPLTLAVHQPNVLVVPTASGITNMQGLLDALRKNPGKYNFPSPGVGTISQLAVELMLQHTNTQATHIAYSSSPDALTSLLAGNTQFAALPLSSVMAMIKDGKLRALAVTFPKRSPLLPDVPTLSESSVPGVEGSAWAGFVISSKVPADIRKKLSDALIQAIHDPAVSQKLTVMYMDPVGSTPAQFSDYMHQELNRWGPLIKKLGLAGSL
jgi:tripartite-type tricarboxylate transporter receptor subunit TctC